MLEKWTKTPSKTKNTSYKFEESWLFLIIT